MACIRIPLRGRECTRFPLPSVQNQFSAANVKLSPVGHTDRETHKNKPLTMQVFLFIVLISPVVFPVNLLLSGTLKSKLTMGKTTCLRKTKNSSHHSNDDFIFLLLPPSSHPNPLMKPHICIFRCIVQCKLC